MSDPFGFSKLAIQIPNILLPSQDIELNKWSVVACDQYTSQPDYWSRVKSTTEDKASSLNIIFPEVFLEDSDGEERIQNINNTMTAYVKDKTLIPLKKPGFVLVDRKTSQVPSRKGLVVSIDLEAYDFTKGSSSLIRATEGTIVDRLPPRIKVRKDADIEVPHIMVLIDDPEKTVIEPLFNEQLESLYDFELMEDSGHLKGYLVDQDKHLEQIASALQTLADSGNFDEKYGTNGDDVLLYAMGDGNHSLATAKAIWEELKETSDDKQAILDNPARYALVELVNIHDEGLIFEPIHRVLFDIDSEDFLANSGCHAERFENMDAMLDAATKHAGSKQHVIPFIDAKGYGFMLIDNPKFTLELASFEDLLSQYQEQHSDVKVDFIHGDIVVDELGAQAGNMGLFFPPISKHSLFKTIIFDGALPRKTFSMGEADEKRFYLEARKIKA